jgi:hypothetical protein
MSTYGRYTLVRRVAVGGMAEIWKAKALGPAGFQKTVAIKRVLPQLAEDKDFIEMFIEEAKLAAELVHPNIVQIFDFGQVGPTEYYIAMEYVPGANVSRMQKAARERGGKIPHGIGIYLVAEAAKGLAHAHSYTDASGTPMRIVHRDISPQNILVTFEGGVKVIDFGVAKAAGRAQHTRTGALKGKYGYMSPEQVAGSEVDGRSDIFALGIVLHELLTGRRLFKADSDVQTLARVRECDVPPPSRLNPQLPLGLDAIVLQALAKDPDLRFRTAQEFRLALEDWLIQGRMSASSAHLAEFLKLVYAERLDKEARLGPLLGDAGFTGPAPGGTPAGHQPRAPTPAPGNEPTTPQRHAAPGESPAARDPSQATTESGKPGWRGNNRMRLSVAAAAPAEQSAEVTLNLEPATASVVVDGAPSQSRFKHKPGPVRIEVAADGYAPQTLTPSLLSGPQAQSIVLRKSAPSEHTVTLSIDPVGTEIYEGARLVGRSPKVWAGAGEGEHELTFRHDGYRAESGKVLVSKDGEEFSFKPLKKNEAPRKAAPDLGIKAER